MIYTKWIFALLAGIVPFLLHGSELTYAPINPSFGGYSGNGTYLLNSAQAQNDHKDPNSTNPFDTDSLENFEETLNRLILSQLARRIVDEAFGTGTGLGDGGTFASDNFTLEIDNTDPSLIVVIITDTITGEITTIEIPTY